MKHNYSTSFRNALTTIFVRRKAPGRICRFFVKWCKQSSRVGYKHQVAGSEEPVRKKHFRYLDQ